MTKRPLIRIPSAFEVVLAVLIAGSTLATIYLTWSRASVRSLALNQRQKWQTGTLDQVRMDDGPDRWITGATQQDEHFRVVRWPANSAFPPGDWLLPFPAKPTAWTLSPSGGWLHAVVGNKLISYDLTHHGEVHTANLGALTVQALTPASESQAAVLYRNGSYEVWEAASGTRTASGRFEMQSEDVLRAENGALINEHSATGQTEVIRFDAGEPLTPVQIEGRIHVRVPASLTPQNNLAVDLGRAVRWEGTDLPLPGAARNLQLGDAGWLFATGDFDDVYAVAPAAEPLVFNFGFRPRALLAVKDRLLAATDQDLLLFELRPSNALRTHPGWPLLIFGGLSTLGGLYILSLFLEMYSRALLRVLDWKKPRPIFNIPLPPPPLPEDLVEALCNRQVILWAGSGLMTQSDYPTRTEMVQTMLDVARRDQWTNPSWLSTAERQFKLGDTERAVDALVRSGPEARKRVEEFTRRIYRKWTTILTAQKQPLSQLPLAGAVSTNYGRVFEDLNPVWESHVSDLNSFGPDGFFFLKLYGDVTAESSVLLSREELALNLPKHAHAVNELRELAEHHAMLFLGCSGEALLRDLDLLGIPRGLKTHYAVVAVKGTEWQQVARDLWRDHGVRVIPLAQANVSHALSAWLAKLISQVEAKAETAV